MLIPGTLVGPYEIQALIGQGGMGEVYRARDTRLHRAVAIKVLPDSFTADDERLLRFEQEARAAAALSHPGIVSVFDIGTHEGVPFIVMELLSGQSLRQLIAAGRPSIRKSVDIALQIARALAAAHAAGIVHRDLKPENVFITADDSTKVLDFGIAKLQTRNVSTVGETATVTSPLQTSQGVMLGTMGYMAPEQIRGAIVDHRVDIFALGATLYELLTGTRAFAAGTSADTIAAVLHSQPVSVTSARADVPPALERIVERCVEKTAEARFQSAGDLAFALETLSTPSRSNIHAVEHAASRPRSRWLGYPMRLLAFSAVVGAAWLIVPRGSSTAHPTFARLTFQRGLVHAARFTPDGQSVVYSAAWNGRPTEIFSTRIDAPDSRPLGVGTADVLSVSRAGEMAVMLSPQPYAALFFSRGTLASVPLLGGSPRELLEGIADADWHPQGQLTIIRTGTGNVERIDAVEYPPGTRLFTTPRPAFLSHLRVSPNGEFFAFARHPFGNADDGELIVIDVRGKQIAAAKDWKTIQGIAWRPDSREVWFTAASEGGNRVLRGLTLTGQQRVLLELPSQSTLRDVASDGRVLLTTGDQISELRGRRRGQTAEEILPTYDWPAFPNVSTSGQLIVWGETGEAVRRSGYGAYLLRPDSRYPVRLGASGGYPTISGDEKLVAGSSEDATKMIVFPVGAGGIRQLAAGPIAQYVGRPWWVGSSHTLMFNGVARGSSEQHTYVQGLDDPEPRRLSHPGALPAPDGTRYLCRVKSDLGLCRIESEEFRPIPFKGQLTSIGWATDGSAIIAHRPDGSGRVIFRVDVKTGATSEMRRLAVEDATGLMAIGSPAITADGEVYAYPVMRHFSQLYIVHGIK